MPRASQTSAMASLRAAMTSRSIDAGQAAILGKFHGERALALGHAAQVGRVAEGLREGHLALDAADRAADFGGHDHAAAGGQIAHHRPLEVGRTLDLDLHHGLQQHRPGGGKVLPHAGPAQVWKAISELSTS